MKKIRVFLTLFIVLLLLSGITAFPLRTEMIFLMEHKHWFPTFIIPWIDNINRAVLQTPDLVLYGTDWLAFGHIIISLFFVPVLINPVKYKINLVIGMLACLAVFPLAFICGPIRGIPFFHQLIDCSFGLGGLMLLYFIYRNVEILEKNNTYA